MNWRRPIGAAVLTAVGWLAVSILAAAEKPAPQRDNAVQQATYTTGANGNVHKWLPKDAKTATATKAVYEEPGTVAKGDAVRLTAGADPFRDPFGDAPRRHPAFPVKTAEKTAGAPVLSADALSNDRLLQFPGSDKPTALSTAAKATAPASPAPSADTPEKPPAGASGQGKDIRDIERELAAAGVGQPAKCPTPDDLKPINKITSDISAEKGQFPDECPIGDKTFELRCWAPTTYSWTASALCHKPLYFEQVHSERYGHTWGCLLQPVLSAGHFFVAVPLLPYSMGLVPPGECVYAMGYYRPGSCAPYMLDPFPLSVRAGLAEAGVATGLVFILP